MCALKGRVKRGDFIYGVLYYRPHKVQSSDVTLRPISPALTSAYPYVYIRFALCSFPPTPGPFRARTSATTERYVTSYVSLKSADIVIKINVRQRRREEVSHLQHPTSKIAHSNSDPLFSCCIFSASLFCNLQNTLRLYPAICKKCNFRRIVVFD